MAPLAALPGIGAQLVCKPSGTVKRSDEGPACASHGRLFSLSRQASARPDLLKMPPQGPTQAQTEGMSFFHFAFISSRRYTCSGVLCFFILGSFQVDAAGPFAELVATPYVQDITCCVGAAVAARVWTKLFDVAVKQGLLEKVRLSPSLDQM